MEWLKSGLGQIIALAAIASTIAGFGYAGAGYVQRLEVLEKKSSKSYSGQIIQLEKDVLSINERLSLLSDLPGLRESLNSVEKGNVSLTAQHESLKNKIVSVEKDIEKLEIKLDSYNDNPLAN